VRENQENEGNYIIKSFCSFFHYSQGEEINGDEMGGECSTHVRVNIFLEVTG
jgi:hypothetical protein